MPNAALARLEVTDQDMASPYFAISRTGLRVVSVPDFDTCAVFSLRLATYEHALAFAVGDFINYVEDRFGEQAAQIVDADTFAASTISVYRWVAKQVATEDRLPSLTFKHHQLVAGLNPIQQREWLSKAENDGDVWSTARLAAAVRNGGDAPVTAIWLLVRCADQADCERLQGEMTAAGRATKVQEKRERTGRRRAVTARVRGRKRGGKRRR